MNLDWVVLLTISGMAMVTQLTRFAGYWLVQQTRIEGRLERFLNAIPGAVLAAVVAPAALGQGLIEFLAAVTAFMLARHYPVLLAIFASTAMVVLLRYLS